MENEKENEKLTIIIGDRQAPIFEMTTTIQTLSKVIEWLHDLGRPTTRAYPVAQIPSFAKEEPIEVEEIRSRYRLMEKQQRLNLETRIAELHEQELMEIRKWKGILKHSGKNED